MKKLKAIKRVLKIIKRDYERSLEIMEIPCWMKERDEIIERWRMEDAENAKNEEN